MYFPLPTVVLLDLNMPGRDGFDVLEWIREQPGLRRLRVYVLSASDRAQDIARAYDLGANSYLVKPRNLDGLTKLATGLVTWLRLNRFAPMGPTIDSEPCGYALPGDSGPRSELTRYFAAR